MQPWATGRARPRLPAWLNLCTSALALMGLAGNGSAHAAESSPPLASAPTISVSRLWRPRPDREARRQNLREALALLRQALSRKSGRRLQRPMLLLRAMTRLTRLSRVAPLDPDVWYWLGWAAMRDQDEQTAIAAWRHLLRIAPNHHAIPDASFSLGVLLAKHGHYSESVRVYQVGMPRAARLSTRSIMASNCAESAMAVGDLALAIHLYNRSLALRPQGNRAAWWGLTVALDRQERTAAADRAARRALLLDPTLQGLTGRGVFFVPPGDVHYYLGMAYEAAGRLQDALAQFLQFLRKLPRSRYAPRGLEHIQRLRAQIRRLHPTVSLQMVIPRRALTLATRLRAQVARCYRRRARRFPVPEGTLPLQLVLRKGRIQRVLRVPPHRGRRQHGALLEACLGGPPGARAGAASHRQLQPRARAMISRVPPPRPHDQPLREHAPRSRPAPRISTIHARPARALGLTVATLLLLHTAPTPAMATPRVRAPRVRLWDRALMGRWQLADALLRQAIKAARGHRYHEADAALRRAIRLHPQAAPLWFALGSVSSLSGHYARCVRSLRRSRRLDPLYAPGLVAFRLGLCLSMTGSLELALHEYHRAGRHVSVRAGVLRWNVADTLMALGRIREAVDSYREAIVRMPHEAVLRFALAVALHRQGRFRAVYRPLRQGLRLDPSAKSLSSPSIVWLPAAEPWYYRAVIHLGQGRLADAVDAWRRFLQAEPDTPWRWAIRADLRRLGAGPLPKEAIHPQRGTVDRLSAARVLRAVLADLRACISTASAQPRGAPLPAAVSLRVSLSGGRLTGAELTRRVGAVPVGAARCLRRALRRVRWRAVAPPSGKPRSFVVSLLGRF